MRDFFIASLERLIDLLMGVLALIVLGVAVAVYLGGQDLGTGIGGIWAALGVLIAGGLILILFGGTVYLGIGIYRNTRRTADLLERQSRDAPSGQKPSTNATTRSRDISQGRRTEPPVKS